MTLRAVGLAATLLVLPAVAVAQAAPTHSSAPDAAGTALLTLDASGVKPGLWAYQSTMSRDGQTVALGERTLAVSATTEGERPAWLIVDRIEAGGQSVADSLFVSRDSLQPLRRVAAMGPMIIRNAFTADSITGSQGMQGTALPIALARPEALMVNSGMLETAFTLVPLRLGWQATVHQLLAGPAGTSVVPVDLAVTGEDTVAGPAGPVDSWRLSATAGGAEQTIWLAKADRRLVRMRSTLAQMQGVTYETVLTGGP